jgi:ATP-dependent protease ClpP protease subunit
MRFDTSAKHFLPAGWSVMASLAALPAFDAGAAGEQLSWCPRDDVMARWQPQMRAVNAKASNRIEIYETIGEDWWTGGGVTSKSISRQLANMSGDIEVVINSRGGDYFEGGAIYNLLREHDGKVTVKVISLAASAASVIAMAADELLIGDNASIMIHNAWLIAVGNRNDFDKVSDTLGQFDEAMARLYAKRTGGTVAEMSELMDAETWFTGQAAVDAGFADALMEDETVESVDAAAASAQRAEVRAAWALKKQNPDLTRKECRALLADLKGTPRAVQTRPDTEQGLSEEVQSLISKIRKAS